MNAEQLAKTLAARFLEEGSYDALGTPLGERSLSLFAAAAATQFLDSYFEPDDGFSGLAVQSVGYTPGLDQERVIVYVTKASQKALKAIPQAVEGIPISAFVMGKLKAGPAPAMSMTGVGHYFERNRRFACGSSCAPSSEQYAGTVGAFLTDGVRYYALSNNHVFAACNHTPVAMPILAPAPMDAKPNRTAPSELCLFEGMVELRSGVPGLVTPMMLDAAYAVVRDSRMISSWQGDDLDGFDTPDTIASPRSGMKVKKFGRTTGLTTGIVEAFVPTPWVLPYKSRRFSAEVWFQDTWTIRTEDGSPFALPGDSGSLVVTEDGTAAIGLIFAVNNRGGYAICCELERVLAAFGGLNLLSNHGI
jgi:hypothetical protein